MFFHNHGNPGPGLYLPDSWKGNRVQLRKDGSLLGEPSNVKHLEPLPPEGFYRPMEAFYCCEKKCREFQTDELVQLGYNGQGDGILFVPEIVEGMLAIPERGSKIDAGNFAGLKQLKVRVAAKEGEAH